MAYVSPWLRNARAVIAQAVADLPTSATPEERLRAIDIAYPFGPRERHPYKQWLKARREYLSTVLPKAPAGSGPGWREKMRAQGYSFPGDDE